jgi:hypothetical protein
MSLFAVASQDFSPLKDLPFNSLLALGLTLGGVLLLGPLIVFRMVMRHLGRGRELLNTERIKALELGRPPVFSPPPGSRRGYGPACWLGAGVPMVAACAAAWTTIHGDLRSLGPVAVVWVSVAVIGVASVICATVLLAKARSVDLTDDKTVSRNAGRADAG